MSVRIFNKAFAIAKFIENNPGKHTFPEVCAMFKSKTCHYQYLISTGVIRYYPKVVYPVSRGRPALTVCLGAVGKQKMDAMNTGAAMPAL